MDNRERWRWNALAVWIICFTSAMIYAQWYAQHVSINNCRHTREELIQFVLKPRILILKNSNLDAVTKVKLFQNSNKAIKTLDPNDCKEGFFLLHN